MPALKKIYKNSVNLEEIGHGCLVNQAGQLLNMPSFLALRDPTALQSLYCLLPTGPLPCGMRLVETLENNSYCLLNLFERESIFRKKKRDNWKALYSSFSALGHWFFRCCNVLHGEMVPWTFIHISDSSAHSTHCKPFTFRDSVCLLVFLSDLNLF